jgi:hypothetical protein
MWQRLLHAIDHDAFGKGSALPGAGQRRRKAKAQLEAILAELARPSDEMLAASGCECGADDAEAMRHRRDDFAAVIRAVGAKRGARDGA